MINSRKPKSSGENSYIVRLYRCSSTGNDTPLSHDSFSLTGIVERTDNGQRASFRNIEELWRILAGLVPFTNPGMASRQDEDD